MQPFKEQKLVGGNTKKAAQQKPRPIFTFNFNPFAGKTVKQPEEHAGTHNAQKNKASGSDIAIHHLFGHNVIEAIDQGYYEECDMGFGAGIHTANNREFFM